MPSSSAHRRPAVLGLAAAGTLACGSEPILLTPPNIGGARAAVLASLAGDEIIDLRGIDLALPGPDAIFCSRYASLGDGSRLAFSDAIDHWIRSVPAALINASISLCDILGLFLGALVPARRSGISLPVSETATVTHGWMAGPTGWDHRAFLARMCDVPSDASTVGLEAAGVPISTLRVEVVEGPDLGSVHVAGGATLSVGSASGNDLVLSDETVSRFHVELNRGADRILVRDLGSTNGVLVGGARIERGSVLPGTVLRLGRTGIRVSDGDTIHVESAPGPELYGLIAHSAAMRALATKLSQAGRSTASILLLGETGTGKEVAARGVHLSSERRERPFEVVDCGTMLPTLIASELFGHERGSFTGAESQHAGAFERAHGGTLFLDEVGELPPTMQVSLLGALERREFRRLGGRNTIKVDVRVISATSRDLRSEVNAGRFRQDLYYRLAVVVLGIPPLRERPEDIPFLVEHFLRAQGHQGPVEEVFSAAAMTLLQSHQWPGNVRELRNVVEAACVTGEAPLFAADDPNGVELTFGTLLDRQFYPARDELVRTFERAYLERLLSRAGGNISRAARQSRIERSQLSRLVKRYGISAGWNRGGE